MAVFKLNNCIFENCGMVFNNLEALIWHIETNHINYDPKIIEQFEIQQPTCLPLSYVLRFFGDSNQSEKDFPDSAEEKDDTDSKLKQTLLSTKTVQTKIDDRTDSTSDEQQDVSTEKSVVDLQKNNNSWTNVKTNNSVNFCKMKKTFKCHCGRAYGSNSSLKKHAIQCHNAAVITAQVKEIFQQGTDGDSLNKLIQPYRSISLKRLSAASTPLKTLIVSTKATNASSTPMQNTQQSPRLMIQLSDLHAVSS